MNSDLAAKAMAALTDTETESMPGYCLRWVRQVVQQLYGHRFDAYFAASAAESERLFNSTDWAHTPNHYFPANSSEIGDLLFKSPAYSGRHGHVAIRVPGNFVAENSTCHTSERDRDARGLRTLANYGRFSLIVRLPRK